MTNNIRSIIYTDILKTSRCQRKTLFEFRTNNFK